MVKEVIVLGCVIVVGVGVGIFLLMVEIGERLVRWERTYILDSEKYEFY